MTKPQLSIRSAKARRLAYDLRRRTGMTMSQVVERALERFDDQLRQDGTGDPLDAVWRLAARAKTDVPADTTSAHDNLYDDHGLPR